MAQEDKTAYSIFIQACWAQHKRQYPDEHILKEIEEFNKLCSVWWYKLSEEEQGRFQEMADRSNLQALATQVINNTGTVLNYNTNPRQSPMVQQRTFIGGTTFIQRPVPPTTIVQAAGQPIKTGEMPIVKQVKDPNRPRKPLSAYFLFCQDIRLKVKTEFPLYNVKEVAKEMGRRWNMIDTETRAEYEARYKESRKQYEERLAEYNPHKKKKDPNAPKQPLSAYFLFVQEERQKFKAEHPKLGICEVAKVLGKRWAEMSPELRHQYQQRAEIARQKYDIEMAEYRMKNNIGRTVLNLPTKVDPLDPETFVNGA